jgi:hypothetical protein
VKPLGFNLEDRQLARAGLDYHDLARVSVHEDWQACQGALAGSRLFFVSTRGGVRYDTVQYRTGPGMPSSSAPNRAACRSRCWRALRRSGASACPWWRATAA